MRCPIRLEVKLNYKIMTTNEYTQRILEKLDMPGWDVKDMEYTWILCGYDKRTEFQLHKKDKKCIYIGSECIKYFSWWQKFKIRQKILAIITEYLKKQDNKIRQEYFIKLEKLLS